MNNKNSRKIEIPISEDVYKKLEVISKNSSYAIETVTQVILEDCLKDVDEKGSYIKPCVFLTRQFQN